MLNQLFNDVQHSALPALIDGAPWIAMVIQGFHLTSLIVLLGLVVAFNTRLQGFTLALVPAAEVARSLQRPYVIALVVAVVAGLLLALPRLVAYSSNPAFAWKLALLVSVGILQAWLLRRTRQLPVHSAPPLALRIGSAFALLLWLGTGMAGRAIGFV